MKIDARGSMLTDVLKRLKEVTSSGSVRKEAIEVITASRTDAKQVKAFASMSGFETALYQEDDHYRVTISGDSCGCSK